MAENKLVSWCLIGDGRLVYLINGRLKCPLLDFIMPKITHLGGAAFSIGLCLLLYALNISNLSQAGLKGLAALTGSHILVQLIKRFINRIRPYLALPDVNTFPSPLQDYSFPSGHSTAAFSLATILSLHFPGTAILFVSLATIVGLSRIYLGLHYPSDVLIGGFLGAGSSVIIFIL